MIVHLSCNFCHKWVCTKCLEVSEDLYKVLMDNPKAPLLVPCKECGEQVSSLQDMRQTLDHVRISLDETRSEVRVGQISTTSRLDKLQSSQDMAKTQLVQLKVSQDESKIQLNQISSRVTNLKQDLQKTVEKVVKQEVESQLGAKIQDLESRLQGQINAIRPVNTPNRDLTKDCDRDEIEDLVAKAISEERDKERRRPNLMIFNVPEVNSTDSEKRKQYDKQMVISILNQVMEVRDIEHKILKVIRMGRRDPESTNLFKRPLKVKFNDIDTKFKFLQKAYKLRELEDESMKEIRISNDRTPQESDKYRKLRAEMEIRKERGEAYWRIRRGKLVWINRELEEPIVNPVPGNSEAGIVIRNSQTEGLSSSSSESEKEIVLSDENVGTEQDGASGSLQDFMSRDSLRGFRTMKKGPADAEVLYSISPERGSHDDISSAKAALESNPDQLSGGVPQRV